MRRLSLSLLVVVLLATIGLGWAIDRLFAGLDSEETDSLQVYRQLGASLVQALDGSAELAGVVARWPDSGSTLTLIGDDELALPPELQDVLDNGQPLTLESELGITLYFSMPESGQVLLLVPPQDPSRGTPLRFVLTIVFYVGIILLILIWLYPLVSRLQKLATAAKSFGEGELGSRVSTHRHSNLHDIELEFNNMAARIQRLVADNKLLSSAVSHDLRTPLARLRFGIDSLSEADDAEQQANYLTRISADLAAMEELVEIMLEYARLDGKLSDVPMHIIDLNVLVSTGVNALGAIDDYEVQWQAGDAVHNVLAHERYAGMLVNNILQNAINHGHSKVHISITVEEKRVWLNIEDDGPGIPAEEREDVLKPFVRGGTSNAIRTSRRGFGLGLAIVNRIAEWHGAELHLTSGEVLSGACVRVGFPRQK